MVFDGLGRFAVGGHVERAAALEARDGVQVLGLDAIVSAIFHGLNDGPFKDFERQHQPLIRLPIPRLHAEEPSCAVQAANVFADQFAIRRPARTGFDVLGDGRCRDGHVAVHAHIDQRFGKRAGRRQRLFQRRCRLTGQWSRRRGQWRGQSLLGIDRRNIQTGREQAETRQCAHERKPALPRGGRSSFGLPYCRGVLINTCHSSHIPLC